MYYIKCSIVSFHFSEMLAEFRSIQSFFDYHKHVVESTIFLLINYLIIGCFYLIISLNSLLLFIILNYYHLIHLFFILHSHFFSFFTTIDFGFQRDSGPCFGFLKLIHLLFFSNLLLRSFYSVNLNYSIDSFLHASKKPVLNQFYLRMQTF
jgi:hypothetical protein